MFPLSVILLGLFSIVGIALSDDGYTLWMKYNKIDDEERLSEYQRAISTVVVSGTAETSRIIRDELGNGLRGLLAKEVTFASSINGRNGLLIGTPRSSEIVGKLGYAPLLQSLGDEGYLLKTSEIRGARIIVIAANADIGLLYGTFCLLRLIQTHRSLDSLDIISRPKTQYRLLDHWDNLDGSIERGYAGKSLWKWDDLPGKIDRRYRDYARANASVGINGTVLNNVNADPRIMDAKISL